MTTVVPRPLSNRVKAILLSPRLEWPVIADEPATLTSIYTGYVLILAAIPAVCSAIGLSVLGMSVPFVGTFRIDPMTAIRMAVVRYVASVLGVYLLALTIDTTAPTFGGHKDLVRALKVAAYASTAGWVVGVFSIVPALSVLGLLGLYGLYLLYTGLPVLMHTPPDRAQSYTVVVVLTAIVVTLLVGAVTTRLGGMPGGGMSGFRLAIVAAPATRPMTKGLRYTFTVSTSRDGAAPQTTLAGTGQFAGDQGRVDLTQEPQMPQAGPVLATLPPMFTPGNYFLVKHGGDTLTLVDPHQKKYWSLAPVDVIQGLGATMALVKIEYSNTDISVQRVQPDSSLDGYAAQHWRLTDNHTERVSVMFVHGTSISKSTYDYYIATDFKDDLNPFTRSNAAAASAVARTSDYAATMLAAQQQMAKGVPLLVVTQTTTANDKGKQTSVLVTRRIDDIAPADIPASVFEIPADYTLIVPPPPSSASAGRDSTKSLGAIVDTAATHAGKDAATDAKDAVKQKARKIIHFP
jgi:hypothetical protein